MFGTMILAGVLLAPLYIKISIMDTYFDLDKSPVWCDVVFLLLGLSLVGTRGTAIFNKWFLQ
jgi:hypothetical protein